MPVCIGAGNGWESFSAVIPPRVWEALTLESIQVIKNVSFICRSLVMNAMGLHEEVEVGAEMGRPPGEGAGGRLVTGQVAEEQRRAEWLVGDTGFIDNLI